MITIWYRPHSRQQKENFTLLHVNAVISRLGGSCSNDRLRVWIKIVECQIFPVLAYGSYLLNFERSLIQMSVNIAYRKGIRRGLGMRQRDSIVQGHNATSGNGGLNLMVLQNTPTLMDTPILFLRG